MNTEQCFYGASTVGERGQIVIPAEARNELNIHPGEKVILMRHPFHDAIMVCKISAMREILDDFSNYIKTLEDGYQKMEEIKTQE